MVDKVVVGKTGHTQRRTTHPLLARAAAATTVSTVVVVVVVVVGFSHCGVPSVGGVVLLQFVIKNSRPASRLAGCIAVNIDFMALAALERFSAVRDHR